MADREILLGEVGVDSGQLMICDPSYVDLFQHPEKNESGPDHGHEIYQHVEDKSYWQFTYGHKPVRSNVNQFPGTYETVIEKYGKNPNELIRKGIFVKTDIDPRPHIPDGEFSYRGICKVTTDNFGGQLNYPMGHAGVAVAFRSGLGDGTYKVKAIVGDVPGFGERVKKVTIELDHPLAEKLKPA